MENEGVMEQLIAKCLSGEATKDEQLMLNSWIKESAANKQRFEESQRVFAASETIAQNWEPDSVAALKKVKARIATEKTILPIQPVRLYWAAAAAIVVFLISVILYRSFQSETSSEVLLSIANVSQIQKNSLPDGSDITLNKGASISYSVKKGRRHVDLTGEAFFEVKHDSLQIFEVQAGDLMIRDIGTAFNVKTSENGDVVVTVKEGIVELSRAENNRLQLIAGEAAVYNHLQGSFEKISSALITNAAAYATKEFEFNSVRLEEIAKQLSAAYGVQIKIDNQKLKNCLFSVSFFEEDLDVIVEVIAETLDMTVQKQQNTILLKGGTCQ